ncbi:MAG: hypothetical protein IT449_09840 [Phycisphaerales bacterium]|nr:hypothetical protein [Phycisphaerales bacterium]
MAPQTITQDFIRFDLALLVVGFLPAAATLAQNCPHREYAWTKTVGGEGGDYVQGNGMVVDANDYVLLVGEFAYKADFDPGEGRDNRRSKGTIDGYVTWYLPNGDYGGTYTFGAKSGPEFRFNSVLGISLRPSGGFAIGGVFDGKTDFDPFESHDTRRPVERQDAFVTTFRGDYSYDWTWTCGGASENAIWATAVAPDGSVFAAGYFRDRMVVGEGDGRRELVSNGGRDAFLVKLSAGGEFQWAVAFGGPAEDRAWGAATDAEGHVILVGQFSGTVDFDPEGRHNYKTSNGDRDVFIVKLAPDGRPMWIRTIGGGGYDRSDAVAVGISGEVFVGGQFSGLVDFDPEGGGDLHDSGQADSFAFVTRYASDGSYVWTKSFGGAGIAYVAGMQLAPDRIILTGGYVENVDFDPGVGVDERPALGDRSCFVSYWTSDGTYRFVDVFGGAEDDRAQAVATDSLGSVYVAGDFNSPVVDFDPTAGVSQYKSKGSADIYLTKFYCGTCEYVERHDLEFVDGFIRATAYTRVPGGKLTWVLTGPDGEVRKTRAISGDGVARFVFPALPPGDYRCSIRHLRDANGADLCTGRIAERRINIP